MKSNTFQVSGQNFSEAVAWLDGELSKTKATPEERYTANIEFLNRLCMDMIDVVVQFIPLLVFASMAHLIIFP